MEKHEFRSFVRRCEVVEFITSVDKTDSFESAVATLRIPNKKFLTPKECGDLRDWVKSMLEKITKELDRYLNENIDNGKNTNDKRE